jgi:hypothetical protein
VAAYSFKYVRDLLPSYLTTEVDGYEGDPGYDGDQWDATSEYIEELEKELADQCALTGVFHNERLLSWLKSRPVSHYSRGPAIVDAGSISIKSNPFEGLE